jgi:hypothetical protein
MSAQNLKLTTIEQVIKKIAYCENQLVMVKNQKKFPFVYITVAFPATGLFILGSILSEGIVDIFSAIIGGLFFSLLISCVFIVVIQPDKEEVEEEIKYQLKHLFKLKGKLEAGKKGEMEIAYYLNWLNNNYYVFNDICLNSDKYGNQQIDHLVIGPNGIFHVETKNINGTIKISETGDWILEKKLRNQLLTEGMESPHHQIRRHELVLRDLLAQHFKPKELAKLHLGSVVAMANSRTIILGKDPFLEVVKKDKLVYYLENTGKPGTLNNEEIKKIALIIALNCITIEEDPLNPVKN